MCSVSAVQHLQHGTYFPILLAFRRIHQPRFGSRFLDGTKGQFGVLEMIMSSAISGMLFSTFAGQPLSILGATGPFLAYTLVVFEMAEGADLEFMPFYFWVCMWCSLFTILVAVFDLCALMKHVTMFSEDIFAGLISHMLRGPSASICACVVDRPIKPADQATHTRTDVS